MRMIATATLAAVLALARILKDHAKQPHHPFQRLPAGHCHGQQLFIAGKPRVMAKPSRHIWHLLVSGLGGRDGKSGGRKGPPGRQAGKCDIRRARASPR